MGAQQDEQNRTRLQCTGYAAAAAAAVRAWARHAAGSRPIKQHTAPTPHLRLCRQSIDGAVQRQELSRQRHAPAQHLISCHPIAVQ